MTPRPVPTTRVAAFLSVTVLIAAMSQPSPALASARHGDLWVVGDSITYVSAPVLRPRLEKTVTGQVAIDGVGGRPVADLDDLVEQELALPGTPSVMVLALGTNPSSGASRPFESAGSSRTCGPALA